MKSDATIFDEIRAFIQHSGLEISDEDTTRPWGGFFVISEESTEAFVHKFFPEFLLEDDFTMTNISPKILLVAPGKRLSWQYHERRSELWKLLEGEAKITLSATNEQPEAQDMIKGLAVRIGKSERHRLSGSSGWGIIAEIWKHEIAENPSNEDDIIRVSDDFGR